MALKAQSSWLGLHRAKLNMKDFWRICSRPGYLRFPGGCSCAHIVESGAKLGLQTCTVVGTVEPWDYAYMAQSLNSQDLHVLESVVWSLWRWMRSFSDLFVMEQIFETTRDKGLIIFFICKICSICVLISKHRSKNSYLLFLLIYKISLYSFPSPVRFASRYLQLSTLLRFYSSFVMFYRIGTDFLVGELEFCDNLPSALTWDYVLLLPLFLCRIASV